ncbi:lactonase family protein [Niabella hibiscisoli]|uniref:lactonase family protein n=1 Tax=Niabella hibiscisoli TaxID=1825928 RepID=UPI001F10E057|nr:lactonase family protein [Niabella hibiscisoli]MCH5721226.1 lactonase family protein [Niabella hibiscisoli]
MKSVILSLLSVGFMLYTPSSSAQRLVIGTYTNNNASKGIYLYDFNAATGEAKELSSVKAGNPSYQAVDNRRHFVYSVNESDEGKISAFKYDPSTGSLSLINQQPNNGSAPCYVSIDKTGKWLFAGNYSSGNLTVHAIAADGSIGPIQQTVQHTGNGPNKNRQESAHVHCTYVSPDNRFLYTPDLGIDKVMIYPFDAQTGRLNTDQSSAIIIPAGGGPRHIVFTQNGKFGYIIEELSGAITVVARKGLQHTIVQQINNLPAQYNGASADIHLSPDEHFLYTSHRGNSTIQIHQIDAKTGRISFVAEQATNGNFPRNFTLHPSGKYLLAANQKSNDITIFKRDIRTGLLTDTQQRIRVPAPVCLQWID